MMALAFGQTGRVAPELGRQVLGAGFAIDRVGRRLSLTEVVAELKGKSK